MISWIGISKSKFHDWKHRYGKANEYNGKVPRDNWTTRQEKEAIIDFFKNNPGNGYRRLCFMMIDQDVAYVSPATVYNILNRAGLMGKSNARPSSKGKGFVQPSGPHRHWHVDISYINVCGTFFYLCSILDGYSRFVVNWELRESMKEEDIEIIIEEARHKCGYVKPRIISDNGPQFLARDFKEYIRLCGMDHVRTSPYYPQSNGKIERWHKELKKDCIRAQHLESLDEAKAAISEFVHHYNEVRLHSAIGYVTPRCKLEGHESEVFKTRDRKLEEARHRRKVIRANLRSCGQNEPSPEVLPASEIGYNKKDSREDKAMLGSNLSALESQGSQLKFYHASG